MQLYWLIFDIVILTIKLFLQCKTLINPLVAWPQGCPIYRVQTKITDNYVIDSRKTTFSHDHVTAVSIHLSICPKENIPFTINTMFLMEINYNYCCKNLIVCFVCLFISLGTIYNFLGVPLVAWICYCKIVKITYWLVIAYTVTKIWSCMVMLFML